jgi:hypothetical protein
VPDFDIKISLTKFYVCRVAEDQKSIALQFIFVRSVAMTAVTTGVLNSISRGKSTRNLFFVMEDLR